MTERGRGLVDIAKIAAELRRRAGLGPNHGDLHDLAVALIGPTAIRLLGDELKGIDPAYRFGHDGDKILVLRAAAEAGHMANELAYGLACWRLRDEPGTPHELARWRVRLACELLKAHAAAEDGTVARSGVHRAAPRSRVDEIEPIRRAHFG